MEGTVLLLFPWFPEEFVEQQTTSPGIAATLPRASNKNRKTQAGTTVFFTEGLMIVPFLTVLIACIGSKGLAV
jgi:hypothetical protein